MDVGVLSGSSGSIRPMSAKRILRYCEFRRTGPTGAGTICQEEKVAATVNRRRLAGLGRFGWLQKFTFNFDSWQADPANAPSNRFVTRRLTVPRIETKRKFVYETQSQTMVHRSYVLIHRICWRVGLTNQSRTFPTAAAHWTLARRPLLRRHDISLAPGVLCFETKRVPIGTGNREQVARIDFIGKLLFQNIFLKIEYYLTASVTNKILNQFLALKNVPWHT